VEYYTFREIQHFRQKWLQFVMLAVSLGMVLLFGYGMVEQLIFGRPWGNKPMSDIALAIVGPLMILLGVGLLWLFRIMRLITEVRKDGVYINFVPLLRDTILFGDIVECKARSYRPIREYGGWGIRRGRGGKAYNVSGNRGVQLTLKNGKGVLIGSQRPEELARAIRKGMEERSGDDGPSER